MFCFSKTPPMTGISCVVISALKSKKKNNTSPAEARFSCTCSEFEHN
uniref:Uncharacterized protein n=1 Tax=Anguilla anguilla TaxID=7936 RepID=A0A0E9X4I4_ANGAN